ncbi:MAG: THUMP domain-containing protein [archaeon]
MKYIAQTAGGMEDISIKEIEELIGVRAEKLQEGRVLFDTTNQKATELLNARSIFRVYEFVQEIEFSSFEDLLKKVKTFEIEDPFVVRCQREGDHRFQSLDAEKEIGELFYNKGHKVDLHNPKTIIIADIINNKCFLGKDLTNDNDLSKREYRVKAHSKAINATLAYGVLRLAGWTKDKSLFNPECKDGVIAIEAALWAKDPKEITATDSQITSVTAAEINSKLAGVHKHIKFTEPKKTNYIITQLIRIDNLFEKAEELLTDKGTILIITQKENVNPRCFKLVNKREVKVHKAKYFLLTFEK